MTPILEEVGVRATQDSFKLFGDFLGKHGPILAAGLATISIGGSVLKSARQRRNIGDTAGDDAVKAAVLTAGGVGVATVFNKTVKPGMIGAGFFAAYTALRVRRSLASRRKDKARDATVLLGTAAAGAGSYAVVSANADKGLMALQTHINLNQSAAAVASRVQESVAIAKKASPILAELLPREAAGVAAAVITIPVAHAIIKRALSMNRIRISDHREQGFLGSQMENQAGSKEGGYEPSQVTGPMDEVTGKLNFMGSIFTSYDQQKAVNTVLGR